MNQEELAKETTSLKCGTRLRCVILSLYLGQQAFTGSYILCSKASGCLEHENEAQI